MNTWTLEGYTKAIVQGRPHLARSSRTIARSGHTTARLGRTTTSRSRTELAVARPQPAVAVQSRPQLVRADHTCTGLGSAAPTGAPAPTICHVLGPRHQQSHKHTLDEWDSPVDGQFDQKAKVGSTWIDGPTLNRQQGVILGVTPHRRCITRWFGRYARNYRAGRTYQLACRAKPTQGVDLQPP
jgi:hypothetical protein